MDLALDCFEQSLVALQRQQKELAERIAYIAPTQSDIEREVDTFIGRSLA